MVAKCANPSCSAALHYLREGRFFRLEAEPEAASTLASPSSFAGGDPGKTEYFWLCSRCSKTATLRLGQDGAVVVAALPEYARRNPEDFAIISRHEGKLLRSVVFARSRERGDRETG
jgi:hypothetical protein